MEDEELTYYSRQILIEELGIKGQEKLKNARVLIIGAGGLGCPALQYLVSAGIGTIGIIDDDSIELTNLHRQVLYSVDKIGQKKVVAAKEILSKLNPYIELKIYPFRLTTENVFDIFENYQIIIDCTDNYTTRFLINDACVALNKPFISGSIYRFEGQVTVYNYLGGPTLRCVFPSIQEHEYGLNCSLSGVIGVLPGIIGTLQANEALKMILNFEKILSGEMLVFSSKLNLFKTFKISKNKDFDYSKLIKQGRLESKNYIPDCEEDIEIKQFTFEQLKNTKDIENYAVLDVREFGEYPLFKGERVIQIPLSRLIDKVDNLPQFPQIIVVCMAGVRSKRAIQLIKETNKNFTLLNLKQGLTEEFIDLWTLKNKLKISL